MSGVHRCLNCEVRRCPFPSQSLSPSASIPIGRATTFGGRPEFPDGNPAEVLWDVLSHFFFLPFDPIIIYFIFYLSFQTLLLPLNLPLPSVETGFNSLACCDASRLQSEDFISEITPNLLPQWQALQKYWQYGRYHSFFLFTAAGATSPATMCLMC